MPALPFRASVSVASLGSLTNRFTGKRIFFIKKNECFGFSWMYTYSFRVAKVLTCGELPDTHASPHFAGINAPTSQSLLNYVLLAVAYGGVLLYRRQPLTVRNATQRNPSKQLQLLRQSELYSFILSDVKEPGPLIPVHPRLLDRTSILLLPLFHFDQPVAGYGRILAPPSDPLSTPLEACLLALICSRQRL